MNKNNLILKVIVFFLLILITINMQNNLNAETIEEKTLSDLGYDNIIINKDTNTCFNYSFKKLNEETNSVFIFQMKIANYIPVTDGLSFKIYLNGLLEEKIKDKNIKKNNIFKLYNIKEDNNLSICVDNKFLPKIVISNNSKIGNYLISEIDDNEFFQIIPKKVYINTLIPIEVVVKNNGYAPIFIEVSNATKKFIKNSTLENVSGETSYKGILNSKETKKIKYYIKVNNDALYISPKAILKYKDEFGNKIVKYTKYHLINVEKNPKELEIYIDVSRKINNNDIKCGKLIFRNTSENDLKDIYITPIFDGKIILFSQDIPIIKRKDVIEIPFEIKTNKSKDYKLSFTINYRSDEENKIIDSNQITIRSNKGYNKNLEIISLLISIMIILYIWVVKI